jgi:DNA-3-methyladenine glycosylase II
MDKGRSTVRLIQTDADIEEGLVFLTRRDRRLKKVIRLAGTVPLRRGADGFVGLARIVVAQQLSVASATAIWSRLQVALPDFAAAAVIDATDEDFRAAGLSAPKIRTLRAIATACLDGFDFDQLAVLPGEEAHGRLTGIKGIGPWTADIYLLFCLGHADIFPAGDLALRNAVADAFGMALPADPDTVGKLAEAWSPWRSIAAYLFWAYYSARKKQKKLPI